MRTFLNMIGLDIGWFACVLAAAYEVHWVAFIVVILIGIANLAAMHKKEIIYTLILSAITVGLGFIIDSVLILSAIYEPQRWIIPSPLITCWLIMLWLNFSFALNSSLKWLQKNIWVAVFAGFIFGQLAYLAAYRLGAVDIENPLSGRLFVVGIAWAITMPVLSIITRNLYRFMFSCERGNG